MATISKFQITGMQDTLQVFEDLANEIGDKKATSKILIPAVREAMRPVLASAKILVPKGDTKRLIDSLVIKAKRPNAKDKKSNYVKNSDMVIATVSTKPISKKHKKEFKSVKDKTSKKEFYESKGYFYDARAVAMEFGTKNVAPKPYLRPALESQAGAVATKLGEIIKNKIEKYKAKNT